MTSTLIPRYLQASIAEAMQDTPVVLVSSPRQAGKPLWAVPLSTLWLT